MIHLVLMALMWQQPFPKLEPCKNLPGFSCPVEKSTPLKCGKFQHVYHWPDGQCGPANCSGNICTAVCAPPPPDKCVDDMHEVSEKEWQDLHQQLDGMRDFIKKSVCYNLEYRGQITVAGVTVNCADMKPKPCKSLGDGFCIVQK